MLFMSNNYHTQPTDKFFKANASIVEFEIDISSTATLLNLVDLTKIEILRQSYEKNKPSYTVFVAKAVAIALMDFPEVNRRFFRPFGVFPRRFQVFEKVDIAIASEVTDTKLAHIAYIAVIKDVQNKSLNQIQDWLLAFRNTESVEQWKVYSSLITKLPSLISRSLIRMPVYFPKLWVKYRGGVCTISSPAKYGVDGLVAAWSSPIGVSFGFVKERAIVKDRKIISAPCFNLTLNFDRRIISGAQGARFAARISEILENAAF